MIKLSTDKTKIEVVKDTPASTPKKTEPSKTVQHTGRTSAYYKEPYRPDVVDAKVYKLKSAFVKNSVFITLGYYDQEGITRPVEIFINSKDLTRAPEYVVLTRLISAIFRRSPNPYFILEELRGIFDPNGGMFKGGKYYHSLYAEIADVIEQFFFDVGILDKPDLMPEADNGRLADDELNIGGNGKQGDAEPNSLFKICPECNSRTLKMENGCDICVAPDCGYSKCDK